jgi:hypothetical protein
MKDPSRTKPPKGYKVTLYQPEPGWYDCRVWRDGQVILTTSMTVFEFQSQARDIGIRRAWDIHDGKREWS